MNRTITFPRIMLIICAFVMSVSGCARYARTVDVLYEPSTTIRGGAEEMYVVIPEIQQTPSATVKWVIGKVYDGNNRQIDELLSSRSPAEIIRAAFVQEFKQAGYSVVTSSKRPETGHRVVYLTRTELEVEQVSGFADIQAKCRVLAGVDVFRDGRLIKRLQYEAASSKIGLRERDLLARTVLRKALGQVMLKAVPDLHGLFTP